MLSSAERPARAPIAVVAVIALGVAVVLAPLPARADVRVERGEDAGTCPDGAAFVARMTEGEGRASITVRFERTPAGYRSAIVTADGKQRSLADEGPTCDGLAEATLLAVRLALDAAPTTPATPVTPVTTSAVVVSAPQTVASPESPAPSVEPRATGAPFGGELLASGLLAVGVGSSLAPGLRGGAAVTLGKGRWSVGITGALLPSKTHDVGAGQVDVSVVGGGVEGCGRARVNRSLLVALCGRFEAFRLSGSAHGFASSEEHARPLFAGTALGRGQVSIAGPLAVYAELAAIVPVVRERFAIDRVGLVYDPPLVGGSGGIGALVSFE